MHHPTSETCVAIYQIGIVYKKNSIVYRTNRYYSTLNLFLSRSLLFLTCEIGNPFAVNNRDQRVLGGVLRRHQYQIHN